MPLTMFDSTAPADVPAGADAYAGYTNGKWPSYAGIKGRFPNVPVLDITVTATADATCLDIEEGDASPNQAPAWVARQLARGVYRPVVYANLSTMPQVLGLLAVAGISRSQVRVFCAHYTGKAHICSPAVCDASFTADGTQWATQGIGTPLHIDISLLADDFFSLAPHPEPVEDSDVWTIVAVEGVGQNWAVNGADKFKIYDQLQTDDGQRLGYFRPGPVQRITQFSLDRMVELPTIPPNEIAPTQPYGASK